jgi:hypothetical protein
MTEPLELPTGAVVTVAPPRVPPVEASPPQPSSLPFLPSPGPRGPGGPSGEGAQIFGETPGGTMDGVNTTFTTTYPFRPASTAVYLNGLREFRGEGYTESAPNTIVLDDPPSSLDRLTIDYIVP